MYTTVYSVAAMLQSQFTLHVVLFPMLYALYLKIITFRSLCAVPSTALFCYSLISYFPGTFFRYCLYDAELVPVAHYIGDITFVCAFYLHCISTVKSLYFGIF